MAAPFPDADPGGAVQVRDPERSPKRPRSYDEVVRPSAVIYALDPPVFATGGEDPLRERLLQEMQCGVCRSTERDPTVIVRCQHTFCRACIKTWIASQAAGSPVRCPMCAGAFDVETDVMDNRMHATMLELLPIRCPAHVDGCRWTGTVQSLVKAHLPSKDELLGEMHAYQSCLVAYLCACGVAVNACSMHGHDASCDAAAISCECGVEIRRGDARSHLETDCAAMVVPCESQGCHWRGSRRDRNETHLRECRVRRLATDLRTAKEKLKNLERSPLYAYRLEDCFVVSGLADRDQARRAVVLKHRHSLTVTPELTSVWGAVDSEEIELQDVETDGIWSFHHAGKDPVAELRCTLAWSKTEGIMMITLQNRRDRFILVRKAGTTISVTKSYGPRVAIDIADPRLATDCESAVAVYANRRFVRYKDNIEVPYVIAPLNCHITHLRFRFTSATDKVKIDELIKSLQEYFEHPATAAAQPTAAQHEPK